MGTILVIGANGQIGSELTEALVEIHGDARVVASDLLPPRHGARARFERLDVLDAPSLRSIVERCGVDEIWLLAALLSASGEAAPMRAWTLNVSGLLNVLELAREGLVSRVFWPSSIAAFGRNTPPVDTPQSTVMDPTTIYGISKLAGERLCEYYHVRYDVDVRSLRYPGIISYRTPPGGGTTDYAIAIFQAAKRRERYECFLAPDTRLPMIYMPDAVRAALELMRAEPSSVRIRSSYNLAAMSFAPQELFAAIRERMPEFRIAWKPDFRQAIAETWPRSIDDADARRDWGWVHRYDLDRVVDDMLRNVPLDWNAEPAVA